MISFEDLSLSDIAAVADANVEFLEAMAREHPTGHVRDMFYDWADTIREVARKQQFWINHNFDPTVKTTKDVADAYKEVSTLLPVESKREKPDDLTELNVQNQGIF